MDRSIRVLATVMLLPLLMGASVTISQPTSGNLTGGQPQQPSGTASGFNQGDYVILTWHNNVIPGQYHFGTVACDEYWTSIDFLNNGWSAENAFSFTATGSWSVVAELKDSSHQSKASTGVGGSVVP